MEYYDYSNNAPQRQKPNNYLVWAILSTVLCCLPFGVVSIVYATQVDNLWNSGKYDLAENAAQKAKTWFFVALGSGLVVGILYMIYIIFFATMLFSTENFPY
ncbi:hypothetical protein M2138_001790 [Dysgonomonadaceae bacterium PH5-43]|nr:hypothetical protein [Dysgonomonadaceae bacterium PH5-43]